MAKKNGDAAREVLDEIVRVALEEGDGDPAMLQSVLDVREFLTTQGGGGDEVAGVSGNRFASVMLFVSRLCERSPEVLLLIIKAAGPGILAKAKREGWDKDLLGMDELGGGHGPN